MRTDQQNTCCNVTLSLVAEQVAKRAGDIAAEVDAGAIGDV